MEHEKIVKSHGILFSVMKSYQFCPPFVPKCIFVATSKKLSIDVESAHFLRFSYKRLDCKSGKRHGHGKSRNILRKVMV